MSECHKESLERHNDSLQNKRSANALHSSREVRTGSMSLNQTAKNTQVLIKVLRI